METTKPQSNSISNGEMMCYEHVIHEDRPGCLFVSNAGIRFQSDDNSLGLILVRENLVNVSATSFACQKKWLLTTTSFIEEESMVSVFRMASGVDLIHAKDNIDALLVRQTDRNSIARGEKLAERQEAAFYAF